MKATKLSDTQLVLLNSAAQRENGSVLPTPPSISAKPPQLKKSLEALLKRQLVAEQPLRNLDEAWREENDQRLGLIITDHGRAAIGIDDHEQPGASAKRSTEASAAPESKPRGAKQTQLIEMLERAEGASIEEITTATGWLPHSARAMLTGLRKKGFTISSEKVDGVRRYRASRAQAAQ